jgi:hypothetical protein
MALTLKLQQLQEGLSVLPIPRPPADLLRAAQVGRAREGWRCRRSSAVRCGSGGPRSASRT